MKKLIIAISVILCAILILNMPLPTKQGINYAVRLYRIPLYIKVIEFIDRDYRYGRLAGDIVRGKNDETEKALAVLGWVKDNIRTDIPEGWPIYDDHIWNIVVRGYGLPDQLSDVFTTLCMYAGMPAGWVRINADDSSHQLVLSFVKVGGRWLIFDVFRNKYFLNDKGGIASIDDIPAGGYDKDDAIKIVPGLDKRYEEYFKNLKYYTGDFDLRVKKQMPIQRVLYEISKPFVRYREADTLKERMDGAAR